MRKFLFFLAGLFASNAWSQSLSAGAYDVGSVNVVDYFVDPSAGSDSNDGQSRSAPRRTVSSIWNQIPQNSALSTGVRINLLNGSYSSDHLPNYWENRKGTATAPIILQAADGYGGVHFTRDINMAGTSYFYLFGVDILNRLSGGYGDTFHCENCDHILLRGNSFNGAPNGRNAGGDVAHETVKFNQSQYIYIENNVIHGADDNGIDWVAVQYGHIRGNRIYDTTGWCMYVKGGSSYILIESNIAYNCGEGGITAGQGSGFEFMSSPWIRYEANYIKIVNNLIHHIEGAALGVNGGFNVLVAHNTAYRVGTRSHVIEVVFGERSCDGNTAACASRRSQGGWGPQATGSGNNQYIGNENVVVANNVIYNPDGVQSASQHFAIYGPRTPTVGGIPSPQRTDTGLIIRGNLIWNGGSGLPLGVEGDSDGCRPSNSSCNETQLRSENSINSLRPDFVDAENVDFRPTAGGVLAGSASAALVDFPALDSVANPIPEGDRANTLSREFSGATAGARPPGALVSSSSSISFPDFGTPSAGPGGNPSSNSAPTISALRAKASRTKRNVVLTVSCSVTDDVGVASVHATLQSGSKTLSEGEMQLRNGRYRSRLFAKTKSRRLQVVVSATDSSGLEAASSRRLRE